MEKTEKAPEPWEIDDAREVFEHLHELTNHLDRVGLMCDHLPDWSPNKVERAMPHFLAMTAANLERIILHQDPVGEQASAQADAARARRKKVAA